MNKQFCIVKKLMWHLLMVRSVPVYRYLSGVNNVGYYRRWLIISFIFVTLSLDDMIAHNHYGSRSHN